MSQQTNPNQSLIEALEFMLNVFDTPIARRMIDNDYAEGARIAARAALKEAKS